MYALIRLAIPLLLVNSAPSHAQCDAVARIFDETICQSDIAAAEGSASAAAGSDADAALRLEKINLGGRIRSIAAGHLLPAGSFTPTPEEVDVFEEFSARAEARRTGDDREMIDTATELLETHEYAERFRQSLESTIATFERGIELSEKLAEDNRHHFAQLRERFGDEYVAELQRRLELSRRESSRRWVASWKLNKALFDKYGGRVIFQQAGIEPIDAYREFLSDIREKGRLEVLDPKYADVFDEFERYLDMGHNYLDEPGETYFDRPYWETVDLDAEQRKRIQELKATPRLGPVTR